MVRIASRDWPTAGRHKQESPPAVAAGRQVRARFRYQARRRAFDGLATSRGRRADGRWPSRPCTTVPYGSADRNDGSRYSRVTPRYRVPSLATPSGNVTPRHKPNRATSADAASGARGLRYARVAGSA